MARLPNPGGDVNQWGEILNDYLSVAHKADGSLKDITEGILSSDVRAKLNATGSAEVADGAITTAKLQTGSVTNDKVSATAAIEQSKIAGLGASLDAKVSTSGQAAENGAVFWGVWQAGNDPTPPDDGKVHWGFRIG